MQSGATIYNVYTAYLLTVYLKIFPAVVITYRHMAVSFSLKHQKHWLLLYEQNHYLQQIVLFHIIY